MPEFAIPAQLAQAIAEYLSTKPYREVAPMLAALQALKPVPKTEPGSADNGPVQPD
jgi:hypothetical protein